MTNETLSKFVRASLKCGVAILPMAIAFAPATASAQGAAAAKAPATKAPATAASETCQRPEGAAADAPCIQDEVNSETGRGKDIVVTGTSLRGVAPTGTNLISVTAEEIKAAGATSGSQVLATIPQLGVGYFNNLPQSQGGENTAAGTNAQFVNRVNLRPIGPGADTGANTLILVNGARSSTIGVNQAVASPDAVPPALLERVEVNTDGGSAVYGSDAISGVINFVTKRRFDGVQVSGRYGYADDYSTYDANIIAGKDWGSGSIYASYSYAHQDTLFAVDRGFYKPIDFSTGLRVDLNCNTPNVRINAVGTTTLHYYATTATGVSTASFTNQPTVTGTPNVCSNNTEQTLANGFNRHNAIVSFAEDFSDSIKLTVRGRYTKNLQTGYLAPNNYNASISTDNPFFRPVTDAGTALTSYTVLGNFSAAVGREARKFFNKTEQYGGLAELSADIDGNWQARFSANWDHGNSVYSNPAGGPTAAGFEGTGGAGAGGAANAALSSGATITACRTAVLAVTAAGGRTAPGAANALAAARLACFNPYDIASSAPGLLSTIQSTRNFGEGHDTILNFKGVVDGSLFEMPGGKVKLAIGVEYLDDHFRKGVATVAEGVNTVPTATVKQRNISGFAELNIPFVSSANAMPLIREFRLALSGRYDHYTRFGSVFNPRIGANYKPTEWLNIRGTWGKSFRAPTTVDLLGTTFNNFAIVTTPLSVSPFFSNAVIDPSRPPTLPLTQAQAFVLQGSQPTIGPQKGNNWSVGAEFTPVQGFRASINYYNNSLKDAIGNPGAAVPIFPGLANLATLFPTAAQVAAFKLLAPTVAANYDSIAISDIYGLYDFRLRNMGNQKLAGIDYSVRYTRTFGFGTAYISASGNVQLVNKTQVAAGTPYVSNIRNTAGGTSAASAPQSLHRLTLQAGMNSGGFSGTLTLNHSDGFKIGRTTTVLQDRVGDFNVVNLFTSYTFPGDGVIERNLQLSLSVNNVLNTSPPILRTTTGGTGFSNGNTVGRLVQVGLQKKF